MSVDGKKSVIVQCVHVVRPVVSTPSRGGLFTATFTFVDMKPPSPLAGRGHRTRPYVRAGTFAIQTMTELFREGGIYELTEKT